MAAGRDPPHPERAQGGEGGVKDFAPNEIFGSTTIGDARPAGYQRWARSSRLNSSCRRYWCSAGHMVI
jgi:hypothetical protein